MCQWVWELSSDSFQRGERRAATWNLKRFKTKSPEIPQGQAQARGSVGSGATPRPYTNTHTHTQQRERGRKRACCSQHASSFFVVCCLSHKNDQRSAKLQSRMRPASKKSKASRAPPAFRGGKASPSPSDPFTVCALVENRARETCIAVIKASHSSVLQVCVNEKTAEQSRYRGT